MSKKEHFNRRIREAWDHFERYVVPQDAGPGQRTDTRNAFFSGALTMFVTLSNAEDGEEENVINDLRDELNEYEAELWKAAQEATQQWRS